MLNPIALQVFVKLASEYLAKRAILEPGQLVGREILARRAQRRRYTIQDYDQDNWQQGSTAFRTAPNRAFD